MYVQIQDGCHVVGQITLKKNIYYAHFSITHHYSPVAAKGVDPDEKVKGTDWCVTQPFPAGGLGGAVSSPEANAFWNKCFEN